MSTQKGPRRGWPGPEELPLNEHREKPFPQKKQTQEDPALGPPTSPVVCLVVVGFCCFEHDEFRYNGSLFPTM